MDASQTLCIWKKKNSAKVTEHRNKWKSSVSKNTETFGDFTSQSAPVLKVNACLLNIMIHSFLYIIMEMKFYG